METALNTLLAVALIALLFSSLFFYGFRRSGPWSTFWSFLLVLFVGLAFATAWMRPVGPLWYDVAWVDMLVFGLFLALILAAASPTTPRPPRKTGEMNTADVRPNDGFVVAMSIYFWVLIAFAVLVAVGMIVWSTPDDVKLVLLG